MTRSVLVWLIRLFIIGWMVPSVTVSSEFFMRFRYVNDDTGANSPCSSDLSRLCSKFNRSNLWSPSNASGAIVCENNWIILIWHLFEAMQTCTQNLIYAHYLLFVLYIHIQFTVQSMIIGWWKIIERIEFMECPCREFWVKFYKNIFNIKKILPKITTWTTLTPCIHSSIDSIETFYHKYILICYCEVMIR